MAREMKSQGISAPVSWWERVRKAAHEADLTVSQLIRTAVTKYIEGPDRR
jgi:hypothetical protein